MFSLTFSKRALASLMSALIIVTQVLTPLSLFQSVVLAAPTLSISKALGSGTPNPIPTGQEYDYVITWGCNGSISPADDCMNLKVTDVLPAGLQYVSAAFSSPVNNVTASGNTLTVNFTPTVTAGTIGSFTLRVKFPEGTTPNSIPVNNTATIEADGIAPVSSAPVPITTLATDKLVMTKTLKSNGALDNLSVYSIQVCPAGGNGLSYATPGYLLPTNFSISDTLPSGAVFVSSTPRAPDNIAGNILTWNEPGLTNNTSSNPAWSYGCFGYEVTVTYPSSDPANTVGATKVNNANASYTPTGSTPTMKNANVNQTLPATLYGPGIMTKTASAIGYISEEYAATLATSNTGTTTLDYEYIDYIPAEVNFYRLTLNQYISAIEYQKNGVPTWITGVNTTNPGGVVDTNVPGNYPGLGIGDYVSAVKLRFSGVPGGASFIRSDIIGVYINPDHNGLTYTLPHTFTNTVTANIYSITGVLLETQTSSANTNIVTPPRKINPNNIKCVSTASGACLTAPIYAPGNTLYYNLVFGNDGYGITPSEQVAIENPTYVDLLPTEITLDNLPTDFVYTYGAGILGRDPGNNDCKPDVTVTPNFENSGRTLLMFSWAGKTPVCQIPRNENITVSNMRFKLKIGTPASNIQNRATMITSENPPTDIKFAADQAFVCESSTAYTTFTDDDIILGASGGLINGITVDPAYTCFSKELWYIQGEIFSVSNSFQMDSKKCVKGQLDSQEYCSGDPNVARTIRGGSMIWTNKVTNVGNVSVQGLDMIDILPFPGNIGVGNPVNLGSTWQPQFLQAVSLSGAPSGTTVYYSTEPNPCRPNITASPGCVNMTTVTGVSPGPGQWSDMIPTNPTDTRSIRIDFGSNIIAGGQSVAVSYMMSAPINAPLSTDGTDAITATLDDTDVAWNSFGWSATRLSDNTLQSSAPTRVGIEVRSAPGLKLGNYVWHDVNTNGIQDEAASDGINGIKVELYNDIDGNPLTTGDQTLVSIQFTTNEPISGNPGYYLFEALTTSNYFVRFAPSATYPNASPADTTLDANDSDGLLVTGQTYRQTGMYNLTADDLTIDQGFYSSAPPPPSPAALGNFVWIDTNSNGQQDGTELGLNGVTVNLLSSTGLILVTQTTSSTVNATGGNAGGAPGFYYFSNLSAGDYQVQFVLPSGYTFSPQDSGADATDSDATQTGANIGKTGTYTLLAGDNNLTVDAGLVLIPLPPVVVLTGSVGDTVWYDDNGNGIQESTELGMPGITMTLSGLTSSGVVVNQTMMTNGSGKYLFTNLLAGNYTITTNVGTEYIATYDLDGISSRNTAPATLAPGQNRLDVDFGYVLPLIVPPPVISTGGGGSSSIVVSTLAPSILISSTPPPKVIESQVTPPPKQLVKVALKNLLRFTLPEKLLDTGTKVSQKGIKIIKNLKVDTTPMFSSADAGISLAKAPQDIDFWKERLRIKLGKKYLKEEDGNANAYIVIPTTGIVTPITTILGSKSKNKDTDFNRLISGKEIQVNQYLHDGILHYPRSAELGSEGNAIYAGHSSYWSSGLGRYKTVFGNLMELDIGEEVWVYQRSFDGSYELFRHRITASYNTSPTDVNILLPENGKKLITLFTCTPIGGIAGRWIIRGELIE